MNTMNRNRILFLIQFLSVFTKNDQYVDGEGDSITVDSDMDLREAVLHTIRREVDVCIRQRCVCVGDGGVREGGGGGEGRGRRECRKEEKRKRISLHLCAVKYHFVIFPPI